MALKVSKVAANHNRALPFAMPKAKRKATFIDDRFEPSAPMPNPDKCVYVAPSQPSENGQGHALGSRAQGHALGSRARGHEDWFLSVGSELLEKYAKNRRQVCADLKTLNQLAAIGKEWRL